MDIRLETEGHEFVGNTSINSRSLIKPELVHWGRRLFQKTDDEIDTYTTRRHIYREVTPVEVMPVVTEEDKDGVGQLMVVVNQLRKEITDLRKELTPKMPVSEGTPLPEVSDCDHWSRGPLASLRDGVKRQWCRICSAVLEDGEPTGEKVPPPVQLPGWRNTEDCDHEGTVVTHYTEGDKGELRHWCYACCAPVAPMAEKVEDKSDCRTPIDTKSEPSTCNERWRGCACPDCIVT